MKGKDFYINGNPASHFSIRLLASWKVEDADPDTTVLLPRNGTSFIVFGNLIGLKTVSLPVHVFGQNRKAVRLARSRLTAELSNGIVDLEMPDGFLYRCVLKSSGEISDFLPDGTQAECEYTLEGLQCEPKVTLANVSGRLIVQGTSPYMDCRISAVVSAAAPAYKMAGVTWSDVKEGDKLVLDGLEKRILRNSMNDALGCDAADWPKLVPGLNTLDCPDPLTIEYYPTYM